MVSVIIPTYNCDSYLNGAIESVLGQSYKDFEILIIDDGSKDNTKQVVSSYMNNSSNKVKYFYQNNSGVAAARNRGIREAIGEFVSFLDSDDIMMPEMLEKHIDSIRNLDWVFPRLYYRQILSGGKRGAIELKSGKAADISNPAILFRILLKEFVASIRGLIKKSVFEKIGFFDETLSGVEDIDIWLRFCLANLKAGYVSVPLYIWGSHEESLTVRKNERNLISNYNLREKYIKYALKENKEMRDHYAAIFWNLAREAFYFRKYFLFFRCFMSSELCAFSLVRPINSVKSLLKKALL